MKFFRNPGHLGRFIRSTACAAALVAAMSGSTRGEDFVDAYRFTTLAGSPTLPGSIDGVGSAARFRFPVAVAVDAAGNVYVADNRDHTIRKITPAGVVTTLAGDAGHEGSRDGVGTEARFNYPQGVAVDAAGIVYVADTINATIRRISSTGVVTTWAGRDEHYNLKDGVGSEARFAGPTGITLDASGNVYVADTGVLDYLDFDSFTTTVRKITPGAVVTTLAGRARVTGSADGSGATAKFRWLSSVGVDATGVVYAAEALDATVRRITPDGWVTTLAGQAGAYGTTDGVGGIARFSGPWGLATDAGGNVFVVDANMATVRHISPAGVVSTIGGVPNQIGHADGVGSAARFDSPFGIAVGPDGVLYIADSDNRTIRKGTPLPPAVTSQPADQSVPVGQPATFTVGVARTVPAPSLQWQRSVDRGVSWTDLTDDGTWSGATSPVLTLAHTSLEMDGLRVRCVIAKSGATSVASTPVALAVTTPVGRAIPAAAAAGRLLNLSARACVDRDERKLIGGLTIADGAADVIVRAIGPSLATLHQVPGALADPVLTAFAGQTELARNDNWGDEPDADETAAIAARLGAFALPNDSRDAVLRRTLEPGNYTFHVDGADGGRGVALLEIYLVTDTDRPGRLLNLSARAAVGTGPDVLIAGFVVAGDTTVLVRGIGPELARSFEVPGVLLTPYLDVYAGLDLVDRVRAWGVTYQPDVAEALFDQLHAFPLARGELDAMVALSLPGGARTVQLKGADETTGVALAEIYLVDPVP